MSYANFFENVKYIKIMPSIQNNFKIYFNNKSFDKNLD